MRIRRFTHRPTASIARRISRFLPSRRPTVSQAFAPCWRSKRDGHRLKALAVDREALAQRLEGRRPSACPSGGPGTCAASRLRGSSSLRLMPPSLVRSKQPLGIEIEPSDRHHARHVFGQGVKDRGAALFVLVPSSRGPRACDKARAAAVRAASIGLPSTVIVSECGDVQRRAVDRLAVHR